MVAKAYFKDHGGPAPIKETVTRTVRLEEADLLGIMWHGRYPSYLEDGREELGRRHGIGYLDFKDAGVALPIKTLHFDYLHPLRYTEEVMIETMLHWHEGARLNMEYNLFNGEGRLACTAYSVQMMIDFSGRVLLEVPLFYREFQRRWRGGTAT